MTTLLENPMPAIFVGIIAEAVLATVFVSTRRGVILLAMLGVLALVFVGVGLEWLVVTEVERVENTLDGAADGLVSGKLPRVLDYVAESAHETQLRAAWALSMFDFTQISIHNLDISINELTSPPTATAEFNVILHYIPKMEEIPYRTYRMGFTVELRRVDDRWLITDHIEYHDRRM